MIREFKPIVRIGERKVGAGEPPFIIAEMSANHNRDLSTALSIVDAAVEAGVDALKIQTFTPESLTINTNNAEFTIQDQDSIWHGRSLHDIYQEAALPYEWHAPIMNRCREKGLICFSSVFDEEGVDFLEDLGVPCYKISSFELTHIPLVKKAAGTGKPLIISTGMAALGEIEKCVNAAYGAGCREIILLKCTSSYPAEPKESNIRTIPHMSEMFGVPVGLSDHTLGIGVGVASVALGACVLEKHFLLSGKGGGVDSAFSLEPPEMGLLVTECRRAHAGLGRISYGSTETEALASKYRRSIYACEDIRSGERITGKNCRVIRGPRGISPEYWDKVLSLKSKLHITKGTPISWDMVE